jgi:ribosomal protein S13
MFFLKKLYKDTFQKRKLKERLSSFYGLGKNNAKQLGVFRGFSSRSRLNQASLVHMYNLSSLYSNEKSSVYSKVKQKAISFLLEGRLKAQELRNINNQISIYSYKGIRHNYNWPVHGQRTHSHGSTQRLLGRSRKILRLNLRVYFKRRVIRGKSRKLSKKEQEVLRLKKKIYLRRMKRLRRRSRLKMRRRGKGLLVKK